VTAGQADWAWFSASHSDGAKYDIGAIPAIATNKDDLEIVNGSTWNENIVCVRDVITTSDNYRALLFQEPYGGIAQLPGWNAGFSVTGTHTIYNAFEFLNGPGQFYFDKTTGTLYYCPRPGEDMATADVEAPVVEKLIEIAGASTTNRVENLSFQGITFANTDYNLQDVAGSVIDPPVVVPDSVWAIAQYKTCLDAGVEDAYRSIVPASVMSLPDYVFPASCSVTVGTGSIDIRSSGDPSNTVWLAPAGTTSFTEGANMTKSAGDQTNIIVPTSAGTYKLSIVDSHGSKLGESSALLRVK
jgi:hypothetical protein